MLLNIDSRPGRLAALERWLPHTVTIIDRFRSARVTVVQRLVEGCHDPCNTLLTQTTDAIVLSGSLPDDHLTLLEPLRRLQHPQRNC